YELPAGTPPTVSITSPANNASFTIPVNITINANASDDVSVAKVGFYRDGVLIGEDTSSPYSIVWNSASATPGPHVLTAKATDNVGLYSSSSINIMVIDPNNQAPTVSITSPVTGSGVNYPASMTIVTDAVDPNKNLTKVEFYEDGNLLSTVTSAPYEYVWATPAFGTHILTAKAFDSGSLFTTSAPVTVAYRMPVNLCGDHQVDYSSQPFLGKNGNFTFYSYCGSSLVYLSYKKNDATVYQRVGTRKTGITFEKRDHAKYGDTYEYFWEYNKGGETYYYSPVYTFVVGECEGEKSAYVDIDVDDEILNENVAIIYPNPITNGMLTIELNNCEDNINAEMEIFNLQGKILYSKIFDGLNSLTIDVSGYLSSGTYILIVKDGLSIATQKLIVQ
ncbi:MAG: Ig-like domain-containing protein, partial [Prolixibacteraceae bacterium]|nr:Ig-like domain-containing protein [Prolixibacteraceae bacterium]